MCSVELYIELLGCMKFNAFSKVKIELVDLQLIPLWCTEVPHIEV